MIRAFKQRVQSIVLALAAWDLFVLYLAISLGLLFSYASGTRALLADERFLWQKVVFVVVIVFFNFVFGLYRQKYLVDLTDLALRQIASHALAFFAMTTLFYIVRESRIWISALIPAMAMSLIGAYFGRVLGARLAGSSMFKRRVLVLGTGLSANRIELLERDAASGFTCLGFLGLGSEHRLVDQSRLLQRDAPLLELVRDLRAEEIVVALDERRGTLPAADLLECRLHGVQITGFSSFMEREKGQVEIDGLHPSWLVFTDGSAGGSRLQQRIKRLLDVFVSLILLTAALPVILTTVLAVYVEDRGPVLYRQNRVGQGGQTFSLLKFRSMRVALEPGGLPRWTAKNDPRITKVGEIIRRLRIDELPQLLNVLRGEMSLVGPRPEQPEIVEELNTRIPYYTYRHTMMPGITGWAQINYQYGASVEDAREKLKFDLFYVKNFSLTLDILILSQTLRVVLWAEGAR